MIIDDMPPFSSVCSYCKHLYRERDVPPPAFCKAFPNGVGIPDSIWYGDIKHRHPFGGDHGLQFESIKKKAKSPVRKSIETLRDELQKLFPEQKVVIR